MKALPCSGRSFPALALALGLAGCGDETGVTGRLTNDEALALAAILVGQGLDSGLDEVSGPAQSPGPDRAPFTISHRIDAQVPCPLGGLVVLSGSVHGSGDSETGDIDVTLELTQAHRGCRAAHEKAEAVFTLHGDPDVRVHLETSVMNQTDFDFLGNMAGRVSWETDDGRRGSCVISLSFDLSSSGHTETASANVDGAICGVELSQSVVLG